MAARDRRKAEASGRRAESWVALYLRLSGYRILARRFRSPAGEIDIVARRGRTLVFVEVKQRRNAAHALEPVTARAEERIVRTGETFMSRHPDYVARGFSLRFDLVVVTGRWRIDHRRDVFRGW
ncbi:MAG: YraN family protein [Pseudomonadota bacterium]